MDRTMKQNSRSFLMALVAVAALAGCRNVEQEVPESASVKTVRFHAGTEETRTAFAAPEEGVYRTLWTENDREILLSLNYGKAEGSAVAISADGRTASFEAAFDASTATAPYTFYAVSPASAARAISPSRTAWSVNIAAVQTPLPTSVDEAAQLLVAKSDGMTSLPDEVDLHFSHLTAYGRVTLKNLDLGEEAVKKVDLIFSTPVVGEWYWGEDGTIVSNGASHTITLNTDASGDLWFACAPVSVGGATLTVKLYGEQTVLSKVITFPEGRTFASGKVARFSVDMADAEAVVFDGAFLPVTDVSELMEGGEYLIVNVDKTYALGAQSTDGTAHREQAEIVVEDGKVIDYGEATVLVLEAGAQEGTWSFQTGSGYLSAADSKNILEESSGKNTLSSWTISFPGDGSTTIQALAGASTLIKYNASADRFSCYKESATNMHDVILYHRATGSEDPSAVDPLTESVEYGCYLDDARWVYTRGTDQIFRSYADDGSVTFILLNPASKKQLVVSGFDSTLTQGREAEVSVQYRIGSQTLLVKSCRLTVVREDGPKVWLSAGNGKGIILKK